MQIRFTVFALSFSGSSGNIMHVLAVVSPNVEVCVAELVVLPGCLVQVHLRPVTSIIVVCY